MTNSSIFYDKDLEKSSNNSFSFNPLIFCESRKGISFIFLRIAEISFGARIVLRRYYQVSTLTYLIYPNERRVRICSGVKGIFSFRLERLAKALCSLHLFSRNFVYFSTKPGCS